VKIDGGLSMRVGVMGAGKTLGEVQDGIAHLLAGGFWVTNIPLGVFEHGDFQPLDERWADRVAFHVRPFSRANRRKVRDALLSRYVFVEDLGDALWYGVPRKLRKPGHALARLSWDESLVELNSREWDGGRGRSKDDRTELFENIPMLRKLNVAAFLLVQHEELLDKNARRVCNWYVRSENQRENHRVLGMRIKTLPPLFLHFWYQGNSADKRDRTKGSRPVKIDRRFLTWHRAIYDTLGLYGVAAVAQEDSRIVWLGDHRRPALPAPASPERAGQAQAVTP
jgi:hypothetical protein